MVDHQVHTKVSRARHLSACPKYLLAFVRKPIFAYILIAFAISFSFHLIDVHADQKIIQATRASCERGNDLRQESNFRIKVLRDAVILTDNTDHHELSRQLSQLHLLVMVDCKKAVPDR